MPSSEATINLGYDPVEASRTRAHLWSGKLAGMVAKQVFLVTTLSPGGRPNAAPKSWATPVRGDMFMFCCGRDHHTYRHIERDGEYVVNFPGVELEARLWERNRPHEEGADELAEMGLTALPSVVVRPPRVAECRIHLECVLHTIVNLDQEGGCIVGRIVAVSGDEAYVAAGAVERRPVYGQRGSYMYLPSPTAAKGV